MDLILWVLVSVLPLTVLAAALGLGGVLTMRRWGTRGVWTAWFLASIVTMLGYLWVEARLPSLGAFLFVRFDDAGVLVAPFVLAVVMQLLGRSRMNAHWAPLLGSATFVGLFLLMARVPML